MGVYTNGFRHADVLNALQGRLGWKAEGVELANTSGRSFDDGSFHPIVTVANIKACAETAGMTNEQITVYLQDKEKAVIMQALTSVFNQPELKDNTKLFERYLNNDLPIINSGSFVGIRFLVPSKGISVQIKSLQLYFDGITDLNLYLYKDAKTDPVWTDAVNVAAGEITDHTLTTELILDKGGLYYLGYYQDDLGAVKAIDESPCKWQPSRCFGYRYFMAKKTGADFDRKNVGYTSQTFGINAEVIAFTDHTQSIIQNAPLFDNLIGLQMAYNVMKMVQHTNRSNEAERKQKEGVIMFEADGAVPAPDVVKTPGLKGKIDIEVKRLRENFFPKPKAQSVSVC